MHVARVLILIGAACTIPGWAEDAFGVWTVNPTRSTYPPPMSLVVRFEPHRKGEVFTLNTTDRVGRAKTSSTILYFDGRPHDFQELGCSGTQSSRRIDGAAVEILRKCRSGEWMKLVRHLPNRSQELILEITGQQPDGRRFEQRLVLRKQL